MGYIVNHNTVFEVCTFVHIHTSTSSVRHSFVGEEAVTNRETIPIGFVIFYIVRILFFCKSCSSTQSFRWTEYTVGVRQTVG